jgi:hypothetical protein
VAVVVDMILVPLDPLVVQVVLVEVVVQTAIPVITKEVELPDKEILVEEVDFLPLVDQLGAVVVVVQVVLVTQDKLMGLV